MKFARKVKALISDFGWVDGLWYLVGRLVSALPFGCRLIRYHIVAQAIPGEPLLPARWGRAIEVRPMTEGDPAFHALPLTSDVLTYRFDQGAICFGAFLDGEIAGTIWLCFQRYREDEVRCVFDLGTTGKGVWDFDVYVAPDQRGGLIFARLWDHVNAYLRERGVTWSMSRISAFNPESRSAHQRMGAVRIGTMTTFRAGGWQVVWSSFSPRLHVSTRASSTPVYFVLAPSMVEQAAPTESAATGTSFGSG